MKKTLSLLPALFIIPFFVMSQEYEPPKDYVLKEKEDYTKYEKDMIGAAKWLQATAFNEQQEKRKEVASFVVAWISGSPTVNVKLVPVLMDFEKRNSGMLVLFMASCAQYVLENNYSKDEMAEYTFGTKAMIAAYNAGHVQNKDKKLEKIAKAAENGELNKWIEDNFKPGK